MPLSPGQSSVLQTTLGDRALEQPTSLPQQGSKDFPWSWAPPVTLSLSFPWVLQRSGLFVKHLETFC